MLGKKKNLHMLIKQGPAKGSETIHQACVFVPPESHGLESQGQFEQELARVLSFHHSHKHIARQGEMCQILLNYKSRQFEVLMMCQPHVSVLTYLSPSPSLCWDGCNRNALLSHLPFVR